MTICCAKEGGIQVNTKWHSETPKEGDMASKNPDILRKKNPNCRDYGYKQSQVKQGETSTNMLKSRQVYLTVFSDDTFYNVN